MCPQCAHSFLTVTPKCTHNRPKGFYSVLAVCLQCACSVLTVCSLLLTVCSRYAHCVLTVCSQWAHIVLTVCSWCIYSLSTVGPLCAHSMLTVCLQFTYIRPTVCSQCAHSVLQDITSIYKPLLLSPPVFLQQRITAMIVLLWNSNCLKKQTDLSNFLKCC